MKNLRPLLGVAIVIAGWLALSAFHLLDPIFFSSPLEVASALLRDFVGGHAIADLKVTVYRLFLGFTIGSLIGIAGGLLVGSFSKLSEYVQAPIDFLRSIPVACLFPFFMLVFGLGDLSKVATAAWSTTFVVLINTYYGVRVVSETRLRVTTAMHASLWKKYTWVVIPEALPHIVAGMRIGVSLSLIVVLVTEMFMGTRIGLGKRIYDAALIYDTPSMLAFILLAGVIGFLTNGGFVLAEKKLTHWKNATK